MLVFICQPQFTIYKQASLGFYLAFGSQVLVDLPNAAMKEKLNVSISSLDAPT